jgi:hypothetical protein
MNWGCRLSGLTGYKKMIDIHLKMGRLTICLNLRGAPP